MFQAQLHGFLDDWQRLLSRNVAEARPLLDLVLADRISFTPTADRCYQLTVPIVFDRVLTAAVPDLRVYKIVWRPKGTRTYVDAQTPRKSAGCRLILLSRITKV